MHRLDGKNIYYVITGAPKAKEAAGMISEMVGEGANVFTIPTRSSKSFVDIETLAEIKGNIVKDDWDENRQLPLEDAVLIAPCTFNTLNAIASARADSYPLCLIASSIGKKIPVFLALAMNGALWNHPIVQENIKNLESWGCKIIWPEISTEKVTMMEVGKILDTLYFHFKRVNYLDRRVEDNKLLEILENYREKYFQDFTDMGDFLKKNDLNLYSAGCMSIRVKEGFLITSSGSDMSDLKKENISLVCDWNEKEEVVEWSGALIPSSETPLHCVIHAEMKHDFVLHLHCPRMTYCRNLREYNSESYLRYGTFKLGHLAKDMMDRNQFFIMKYHGEVVAGGDNHELKTIILRYYKKI